MRPKHVALRTCVQCRQIRPKRELVRIVRTPDGRIEIDERGKMPGRGAYLCRSQACWEDGIRAGRLDHALKTRLRVDDQERLRAYSQQLPATSPSDLCTKGDRDSQHG
jgi:predicted RNA-binding protein YlxR (DUF448 family)